MGSGLAGDGDREKERERSRDEKAGREGFGLTTIAGHDGTKMPFSFHPCPLVGYAQFNIRAVEAYSIHLSIGCLGTSITGIYSIGGIYSISS
ncbi:hypothetical protein COCNU_scaffold015648G000010 [Cocos nucifera]|nr:hypothetical protein [Cocos nucifera]